eukprot:3932141-Rhodomonas_salina.2
MKTTSSRAVKVDMMPYIGMRRPYTLRETMCWNIPCVTTSMSTKTTCSVPLRSMYASMPLKPTRLKNEMMKSTTFSSSQHTNSHREPRTSGDTVGEPDDFVRVYGEEGLFGEDDVDTAQDEQNAGYVRGADDQGEDAYPLQYDVLGVVHRDHPRRGRGHVVGTANSAAAGIGALGRWVHCGGLPCHAEGLLGDVGGHCADCAHFGSHAPVLNVVDVVHAKVKGDAGVCTLAGQHDAYQGRGHEVHDVRDEELRQHDEGDRDGLRLRVRVGPRERDTYDAEHAGRGDARPRDTPVPCLGVVPAA